MKKGFTLIELLIVMVIVGVLVTVAVPKYNASMERSRSLEGILNLEKLSSEINAFYVINGNSYPNDVAARISLDEIITSTYFQAPEVTKSGDSVTVTITRDSGSGYNYKLAIVNSAGEAGNVQCLNIGSSSDCDMIEINLSK